jgi:Leucine-rich repeat (LRR) protein
MLDNLKSLDLEGNLIDDIKQIEFLGLCGNLKNLTVIGNPICDKLSPQSSDEDSTFYNYRFEIIKVLPTLSVLDDEFTLNIKPALSNERIKANTNRYKQTKNLQQCPFDDDWQMINELIDEGIGPSEDKLAINGEI